MAFRASTKKTAPAVKKSSPAKPASPAGRALDGDENKIDVPKQGLSIDDLIGGPVSEKEEKKIEVIVSPKPSALAPSTPISQPVYRSTGPGGYRQPFNRGGGRFERGSRREGYGQGYQQQGYQQQSGYQGGYRRVQRDFVPAPDGAGFTVDINVPTETVKGILDLTAEGHGFLRPKFTPSDKDVYISQSQIRRFLLRNGDEVEGQARQPKENERYWGLLKVEKINGVVAEEMVNRPRFDDLTPIYPNTFLKLETGQFPLSTRMMDLLSPIGFGQRGLIVSPPKAGKTTILKEIAAGVTANYPDVHLMAALIGERPEEVTDLMRSIKGEVLASNFDESPQAQTRVAEIALDRAKRLVEMGKDVVVLLDSITRLARAYNLVVNPSGRTLSGGFDPAALFPAKKFLGAARCIEGKEGSGKATSGSLTVIGTALVDTGSRMDDLIYEEFKGTGNMELHLSRKLQERRVFPAIDISGSGTRHDELMLGEEAMKRVTTLRRMLTLLSDDEQTSMMIERLTKTNSNADFLDTLNQG
ncbi:MAG: transcription termination factor Rho [Candidatus Gottesmanbacteria bacterium]